MSRSRDKKRQPFYLRAQWSGSKPPIEGQCLYIHPSKSRCTAPASKKHGEGKWCYQHARKKERLRIERLSQRELDEEIEEKARNIKKHLSEINKNYEDVIAILKRRRQKESHDTG